MLGKNKQRLRRVHSYFDRAIQRHRIFVFNTEGYQVAELTVSPDGKITVYLGTLDGCVQTNKEEKQ
jgi:hypothetical protein